MSGSTTPLYFRLAELLRAATTVPDFNPAIQQVDPGSEWRDVALQALAEFDAKGYQAEEEIFILRGRDELAADTVTHWAAKASVAGVDGVKCQDALEIAARMRHMPGRRMPT